MDRSDYAALVKTALAEDLGEAGDISGAPLFNAGQTSVFKLLAKDSGVLCGMDVFAEVFAQLDGHPVVEAFFHDGDRLSPGTVVARVSGPTRAILAGERTALNFVSHLSGVASKTASFVDALAERAKALGVRPPAILDTRKTIPGLRLLQKYAVAVGGGQNHRMGLYDMVMLKDNHIDAAGGIGKAMAAIKAAHGGRYRIEVEARTLDDVREALSAGADRIMLDNMGDDLMRQAVGLVAGKAETEASGNMTLERLLGLADSGLDFVSFGELTHTVRVFDFSLKEERTF